MKFVGARGSETEKQCGDEILSLHEPSLVCGVILFLQMSMHYMLELYLRLSIALFPRCVCKDAES